MPRRPHRSIWRRFRSELTNLGLGEISLQQFGKPENILIRLQHQSFTEQGRLAAIEELKAERAGRRRTSWSASPRSRRPGRAEGSDREVKATWAPTTFSTGRSSSAPRSAASSSTTPSSPPCSPFSAFMLYVWFRYEWQFGVNCLVALFPRLASRRGLFSLIRVAVRPEHRGGRAHHRRLFVNDTVVIYDRIREELRRYRKMP